MKYVKQIGSIKYENEDSIGIMTIDREREMNAINSAVLGDLDRAFDEVSQENTRVMILRGAGERAFAAGADINEMRSFTREEAERFGKKGNEVFRKLETLVIPVIAVIYGFALGGGCELALSCDIRLAADTAVFAQPEAGLGITPGFGATQRLARIIGISKAKEMIYTCARIGADEALKIGLVNEVYPKEELMEKAIVLAKKIANKAPIAARACKKAINEGLQTDIESGLSLETELFGKCFDSMDQKRAMQAFIEKRRASAFENK